MLQTDWRSKVPITTWQEFTRIVRSQGCHLLKRLDEFPNSVLVTGCQRSGTTMLARVITQSEGMSNYWFGKDDELDAALILSGFVDHTPNGRYCFQTTYLNECYHEYYEHHGPFKIIWVIRNPYSVVYSLMYNWAPGALEGTFKWFVIDQLNVVERIFYAIMGSRWVKPVRQASLLYNAKTLQLIELAGQFEPDRLLIVDYDEVVQAKEKLLREIYKFISLDYSDEYCEQIHNKSLDKKKKLSNREIRVIKELSEPIYQEAKKLSSVNSLVGHL